MTFQAYLDTIQAKTGKTTADFRQLAAAKGLTTYPQVMAWLKTDFGLGHGHANAMAQLLVNADKLKTSPDDALAKHFKGPKAAWRPAYDTLATKVARFGPDTKFGPNQSYINILRGSKKMGIVQVAAADHMDIGLKLKGVPPAGRLEAAGAWNPMVTHRVRITDPKQVDRELVAWLKQAYLAAE